MMFVNLSPFNHAGYTKRVQRFFLPNIARIAATIRRRPMTRASSLIPGASVAPSASRSVAVIAVVPVEAPALQQDQHQEQDPDRRADGLLEMLHGFEGTAWPGTRVGCSPCRCAIRANIVASSTAAPPGSLLKSTHALALAS